MNDSSYPTKIDMNKVAAISIDSLELGSKVYLEFEDGERVWAGGRINAIHDTSPTTKIEEQT